MLMSSTHAHSRPSGLPSARRRTLPSPRQCALHPALPPKSCSSMLYGVEVQLPMFPAVWREKSCGYKWSMYKHGC